MNCIQAILSNGLLQNCLRLTGALFLIFPEILYAQVFEAKTDTKEVVLGNVFEVAFSLKDAQGERFKAPDFRDFKIVGGPSELRGMSIVNGRTSSHHTWTFDLEAKRTGSFTIGAATVAVDGRPLTTQPLTIKVIPARSNPSVNAPPGTADNLFITGELDRTTAYPGEQLTWRIKLYTQLSLEGADIIELPDFEGFYSKEKRRFDTRIQYQTIKGKKFAVKTLYEEALFPQETGEATIGAAKVRVSIEQPGAFGAFIGPKPVILQTQPISLVVKPMPSPTPENFTGGVGRYDWSVELDRDSLSTDDALTLKISLRGNGDSKRFAPPKLTLPAGLEVFEPRVVEEEEYENGEEVIHSKIFEYIILPKKPGDYSLSPSLAFFDPDTNRFRTLLADSLPLIRVSAGQNYRPEQLATDTLPLPLVLPEPNFWEKALVWPHWPVLWSLLGFVAFLFVIFYWLKKQKKRTPANTLDNSSPSKKTASPLPAKAARERFAQTARLMNNGNPRTFYDELFKSLQSYLVVRFSLAPAQMTQENVRKMLTERNVPSGTIQNLLTVWQTCEQALFAGQTQASQMDQTWRTAESVVQDLEKTYRR